jgi:hypothetical protein
MLSGGGYHKEAAKIIHQLLVKEPISHDDYSVLVSSEAGDKLLEANVFAHSPDSDLITFQSTSTRRFCESVSWEEEKVEEKVEEKAEGKLEEKAKKR